MKKQAFQGTFKALILFMISVLVITGCSKGNKGSGDDLKVFTSKDGQVQLTLDKAWVMDPDLNDKAVLGVSERKKEKYAMVNIVSKSDMQDDATLDEFKSAFVNNTKLSVTNAEESNNKKISINSTDAQLFEITGEAQKVKVHYLVAVLEKGGSFYQVVTWSLASKFESNKDELLKAIESFKILKETPAPSASAPNSKSTDTKDTNTTKEDDKNTRMTTLKSDDKKMEIAVPAYMTYELELSPKADIQASRAAQEEYMMVLRESKDVFSQSYTLTDYYNAIKGSMSKSITNATQTEPKKIQVNGQPALQFELNGEIEKIKISYLITLVETDGNFTQLLFWTLQNRMEDKRDMFIKSSSTFKEL
ncbi:hypothetical protein [Paenibacillus pini]|uniref:Tfp pilus assembly protein, major pilin PilA n=1 Tax=Paenibacillus pini JCM 16418 TaxID=1236976 RepID=W7Z1N4_9BACL|nr:hypothetical protein [Paenibacillus pini]GAF08289.1 Tfp pilus assembly protein, major pilin PilA [Paenibacillus pini JCM 16418]